MNVFPEQTSLVTLTACPGSHDCAIIAILLEALRCAVPSKNSKTETNNSRLPHTLRLIKTPTQSNTHALSHLPYLTDIQPTGATTTRADVLSAAFYLLGRYDQGRRLVSKKRDGHESLEIVNWTRDWIERARGRESQHEQTESKRKSQRRSVSEEPSYDRTHMSHAKVVRRTLHLYLLLEKRLQDRTSGGYLVGGRW